MTRSWARRRCSLHGTRRSPDAVFVEDTAMARRSCGDRAPVATSRRPETIGIASCCQLRHGHLSAATSTAGGVLRLVGVIRGRSSRPREGSSSALLLKPLHDRVVPVDVMAAASQEPGDCRGENRCYQSAWTNASAFEAGELIDVAAEDHPPPTRFSFGTRIYRPPSAHRGALESLVVT